MSETQAIALPAFIASRVAARPLVAEMARHCEEASICPASLCMQAYDARTTAACDRWACELPSGIHTDVGQLIQDASELAATRWRSWCDGVEPPSHTDEAEGAPPPLGAGLIGAVGTEDAEHPLRATQFSPLRLQRDLTRFADKCAAQGLVDKCRAEERWGDLHRLSDLSDKDASHEWLWVIHPHKAQKLEPEEYVAAVRLRLGCGGPADPTICGNCGVATLTCSGDHALLCAKCESTRGHNALRDELHSMAKSVDSAAETEPEGLIASHPLLRPADVLTGAFHNGRLTAVDVGIISPSALGAGLDCVVSMAQRKAERMQPHADQLEAAGVQYQPFAVSCWGRLHPEATQMLLRLAKRLARRAGTTTHRAVLRQLVARVTTTVMRRAARMLLRSSPLASLDDDEVGPAVEPPLTHHAELRAGHPGICHLPPLYPVPPNSAAPGT